MTIAFPTGIDTFVNPNPNDPTTAPSHALQHDNENDAIHAIEVKLGVNNSLVTSTIDWLLKNFNSIDPGHRHTIASIVGLQNTLNSITARTGGGTKIAIDTTHVATSFGVESTLYSVPIPANLLSTNNAIKYKVLISTAGFQNGDTFTVRAKYGGQTLNSHIIATNNYKTATYAITMEGVIVANADTQKQNAMSSLSIGNTGPTVGNGDGNNYGTGTVDSTIIQNLEISVETSGISASNMTADGIIVEQITTRASAGVSNGFEMFFIDYISGIGGNLPLQQIWQFNDYFFFRFAGGAGNAAIFLAFKIDPLTGSPYEVALPYTTSTLGAGGGFTMFVNDDQTKLYVAYNPLGLSLQLTVDEFDTVFGITTYTYTHGSGTNLNVGSTFFVNGTDVYVYFDVAGIVFPQDTYKFVISGSNLTAPTSCSFGDTNQCCWDGTNLWTINGSTFGKWTVAGTVITTVVTTFPEYSTTQPMILPSTFGSSYGIQIIDGFWCNWQPSGGHSTGADTAGETVIGTLRQYTKP